MSFNEPGSSDDSIVLMDGGHRTRIQGRRPDDLADELKGVRERDWDHWVVQETQYGPNGLVIQPDKVVAIVVDRH